MATRFISANANLKEDFKFGKECFAEKDIPKLKEVLAKTPEEEMKLHMKRCVDSGLWNPAP